jgi:hypothetical protein
MRLLILRERNAVYGMAAIAARFLSPTAAHRFKA